MGSQLMRCLVDRNHDGYFGTRADYSKDDQAKHHELLLFDVGGGVGI